ncbi:hypothetical protein [Streptomyces sp. NPDC001658]
MDRFIDYLATRQGRADALKAGPEAGVLRSDVDPLDVGFSLGGILLITTDKGLRDRAGRMLGLLLDGLRHRAGRTLGPEPAAARRGPCSRRAAASWRRGTRRPAGSG